jgi:hypothetical protein
MKELTDYNSERLLVNHRSCPKMWELYGRVEELEPCDFGNDFTRIHLCWSNKKRFGMVVAPEELIGIRLQSLPLRYDNHRVIVAWGDGQFPAAPGNPATPSCFFRVFFDMPVNILEI